MELLGVIITIITIVIGIIRKFDSDSNNTSSSTSSRRSFFSNSKTVGGYNKMKYILLGDYSQTYLDTNQYAINIETLFTKLQYNLFQNYKIIDLQKSNNVLYVKIGFDYFNESTKGYQYAITFLQNNQIIVKGMNSINQVVNNGFKQVVKELETKL